MLNYEKKIGSVVESQPFVVLLVAVALLFYMIWALSGVQPAAYMAAGLVKAPASASGSPSFLSASVNVAVAFIGGLFLWMLNRWYFITHSASRIYVGLYALGLSAVPSLWEGMSSGLIMCTVLLYCVIILYTQYQRTSGTRRVFMIFFILSTGAIFDLAYIGYALPFILGCAQMRCMSLRCVLAAAVGLLTPLWIGWGFGCINIVSLQWPSFSFPTAQLLGAYPVPLAILMAGAMVTTGVLTILNAITIYGHNAKTRANNGVLALLSFWTVLAMVIDFAHALSYVPILVAMMAVQAALCFSLRRFGRGYMAVIVCLVVLLTSAIWQLILI